MTRICCSGLMGAMAMAVMAGQTWGTEPLVGGNIAVVRIGHGNATLTNAGTAVFIDEYTYNDCVSALERLCKDMGFDNLTESIEHSVATDNIIKQIGEL